MTIDWQQENDAADNKNTLQNYAQLYAWQKAGLHNGDSKDNEGTLKALTTGNDEYSYPHWIFGNDRYAFLSPTQVVAIASNRFGDELYLINTQTGAKKRITDEYVRFTHIAADPIQNKAYVVADSETHAGQVLCITENAISGSTNNESTLSEPNISRAKPLLIKAVDGREFNSYNSHAFYYAPRNVSYSTFEQVNEATGEKELPPLLVMVHGGPTYSKAILDNIRLCRIRCKPPR